MGGTDGQNFFILDDPKDFGLKAQRHLTDFVEKDRAALSALKKSFLRGRRVGKSPFDVTEQLAFKQRFWNPAAIDR